jgi:hypothetical protein
MGWGAWTVGVLFFSYFAYAGWNLFHLVHPSVREALPGELALAAQWAAVESVSLSIQVSNSPRTPKGLNPLTVFRMDDVPFAEGSLEGIAWLCAAEGLRQGECHLPGPGTLETAPNFGVVRGSEAVLPSKVAASHVREAVLVADSLSAGHPLFAHVTVSAVVGGKEFRVSPGGGAVPLVKERMYQQPVYPRNLLTGHSSMQEAVEAQRVEADPLAWMPVAHTLTPHIATNIDVGLVHEVRRLPASAVPWQLQRSLTFHPSKPQVRIGCGSSG